MEMVVIRKPGAANPNSHHARGFRLAIVVLAAALSVMACAGNEADSYNNQASVHYQKGEYDQAIDDLDEALRLNPEYAEAYNNRGIAYFSKREYDQAIADYNEALRLNPELVEAYNNRGLAYHDQGEYNQAVADYNEALRLNPEDAEAYNNRGLAYFSKGGYDQAISDYNEALRLNPELVGVYTNRGLAYFSKGEYDQAIADCNEALRLNPRFAEAYNNRGLAYHDQGEYTWLLPITTKPCGSTQRVRIPITTGAEPTLWLGSTTGSLPISTKPCGSTRSTRKPTIFEVKSGRRRATRKERRRTFAEPRIWDLMNRSARPTAAAAQPPRVYAQSAPGRARLGRPLPSGRRRRCRLAAWRRSLRGVRKRRRSPRRTAGRSRRG